MASACTADTPAISLTTDAQNRLVATLVTNPADTTIAVGANGLQTVLAPDGGLFKAVTGLAVRTNSGIIRNDLGLSRNRQRALVGWTPGDGDAIEEFPDVGIGINAYMQLGSNTGISFGRVPYDAPAKCFEFVSTTAVLFGTSNADFGFPCSNPFDTVQVRLERRLDGGTWRLINVHGLHGNRQSADVTLMGVEQVVITDDAVHTYEIRLTATGGGLGCPLQGTVNWFRMRGITVNW